jgi:carbohydrate-selective porin OprB
MIKLTLHKRTSIPYILSLATLLSGSSLVTTQAGDFENWWNGKGLLRGNGDTTQRIGQDSNIIFDTRANLEDMGIKFNGKYKGAMYYTTQAEGPERSFFSNEVSFGADVNLARVLNLDALDGLSLFGNFRYRDSVRHESDVNAISVEGDSMFQPNHMYSGTQFRVTSFGLNYSTKNLLPVEDMIVLRAGWLQPSREFADQPLSKLFLNNAIESSKGIGGNIKFSSSYTAWGGTVEIKPINDVYIKNGLFMATYNATETGNHGLGFRGYSPDTDRNGLWYMGEAGYKPKIGSSKLEGKYAFGGYFFGTPVSTRTGTKTGGSKTYTGELEDGRNGLYIQADQMLFREPSEDASKLSKEGLSVFNLFSFAPDYITDNKYPFYFQTGLVYTGLLPTREKDTTQIAFGYGDFNDYKDKPNMDLSATYVLEAGHSFQINGWWFARPFVQYIRNPKGDCSVKDATVFGLSTGFTF